MSDLSDEKKSEFRRHFFFWGWWSKLWCLCGAIFFFNFTWQNTTLSYPQKPYPYQHISTRYRSPNFVDTYLCESASEEPNCGAMFFCTNFEIPKGAGNLASLHAFLATVKTIFSRMSRFFDQPAQMSAYGHFGHLATFMATKLTANMKINASMPCGVSISRTWW